MEVDEGDYYLAKQNLRQFLCAEKLLGINPEIEVTGVGPLKLPLLPSAADQLSKIGSLASAEDCNKFDSTKLCRTWHFDLSEFSLKNSHWHNELSDLVNSRIRHELGLKWGPKIVLKLSKLLLHEGGDFPFAPFNDINAPVSDRNTNNNEDDDIVFATLSILLPSGNFDGEIVIAFNGQRLAFDELKTPGCDCKNFNYTFFSECNRISAKSLAREPNLALAYNLVHSSECIGPFVTENSIIGAKVKQFLESWQIDCGKHKCDMLSVVFEHKYKTSGLSWQCLKYRDRVVARAIITAAMDNEFDVFLATFTTYERIGSYKCCSDDLDLCDGEKAYTFSEFSKCFTHEENALRSASDEHVISRKTWLNFCKINSKCKNFKQRPANMKDRWCQQAALVLWLRKDSDGILMKEKLNMTIVLDVELAKQLARSKSGHAQEQYGNVYTANISRHGTDASNIPVSFISLEPQGQFDANASICLIDAFRRTNSRHMVQLLVENVLKPRVNALSADLLKELIDCAIQFGVDLALPILGTLVDDETAFYTSVTLLRELCCSKTAGFSQYNDVITWFAPKLLDQLKKPLPLDEQTPKSSITPLMGRDYKVVATATSLLCIYSSLGDVNWLLRVIQYICQTPHRHPISTVTVHALHHWNSWLETAMAKDPDAAAAMRFAVEQKIKFVEGCIEQLRISSEPPMAPQDWTRVVNLPCQCRDCKIIEHFMRDPCEDILEVTLGNADFYHRQNHIAEICEELPDLIKKDKVMMVVSLRKTKATYERQKKSYLQSLLAIRNLLALLPADHSLCQEQQIYSRDEWKINGKLPPTKKPKLEN